MEHLLRIILPAYFTLYFILAFIAKSVLVAKRTGKNPLVLPRDDRVYGLIGFYFKLILSGIFIYVIAYAVFPEINDFIQPIEYLDIEGLKLTGIGLLVVALIWTIKAQQDMSNSWRIGIDTETNTELITSGLFQYSRNPIFFGMIICLIGLFLATPNTCTLIFLIIGYMLMQIQIRLEEEFLIKSHGQDYMDYKQRVRRLI